jgi:uncharacterized protein YcbX
VAPPGTLRDTVSAIEIGRGAPAGTFFDYAPLHLLTTAILAALRSLHLAGRVVSRRFRPNLVIETPEEKLGFRENEWVGSTLVIGSEVRLRVSDPSPRCAAPTLPQGGMASWRGIAPFCVSSQTTTVRPCPRWAASGCHV